MTDPPEAAGPPITCPVCGGVACEPVADDVVRCTNCSYLWVVEPPG